MLYIYAILYNVTNKSYKRNIKWWWRRNIYWWRRSKHLICS